MALHFIPVERAERRGMSPSRLEECIVALGWTQRGLARRLDRAESTIRQWTTGRVAIPAEVAAWLERLARFHDRNPPPQRAQWEEEPEAVD